MIRPGRGWVRHRPGQWVRIGVDIEGVRHWRTYSLSGPPGRPDGCITITVKATPDGFVSRHLVWQAAPGTIVDLAGPDGEFVLPDPPPTRLLLLEEAKEHWMGLADRLHVEHFRPAAPKGGGEGGRVRFTRSGRQIDADGGTPLLIAGENAGVLMPSGCRMGICHSCVARLTSGRVRDLRTGQIHGESGDLVQTCVSAATGPVQIEL